jgi:hypothetical protein
VVRVRRIMEGPLRQVLHLKAITVVELQPRATRTLSLSR